MRLVQLLTAACLVVFTTAQIDPPRKPRQPLGGGSEKLTFNNTVSNPGFRSQSTSISWISVEDDGIGVVLDDDGNLSLENFVTGNSSILVSADKLPEDYQEYWVRSDLAKVMFGRICVEAMNFADSNSNKLYQAISTFILCQL